MNNKIIVGALYDDAECCVQKASIDYDNVIVYGVGINDNTDLPNYHKIDLSIQNDNLIKQLSQLPKPDIIMASPPCESWSSADCGGRMFQNINNTTWEVRNKNYYALYNMLCTKNKRRDFYQKTQSMLNGISTITATAKIIEHFKPLVGIIENPQTSRTGLFQSNFLGFYAIDCYMNLAYYNNYDKDFSKKPTIFKSNIELDLLHEHIENKSDRVSCGSYAERSAIPPQLLKSILNQSINYVEGIKNENN